MTIPATVESEIQAHTFNIPWKAIYEQHDYVAQGTQCLVYRAREK